MPPLFDCFIGNELILHILMLFASLTFHCTSYMFKLISKVIVSIVS
jgi:hypothetical protein